MLLLPKKNLTKYQVTGGKKKNKNAEREELCQAAGSGRRAMENRLREFKSAVDKL